MPHEQLATRTLRWPLIVMGVAFVLTFVVWPFFILKHVVEYIRANYVDVYAFPEFLSFLSFFVLAMGPFWIALVISSYWYQRWYSSHRSKLAQEQLLKLSEARKALMATVSHIELFERELLAKSAETERLEAELSSLKFLNAETAGDLQKKLSALEILNRRWVWVERALSFAIGVGSSLVASYAWQYVQPTSVEIQQSNPAVQGTLRDKAAPRP